MLYDRGRPAGPDADPRTRILTMTMTIRIASLFLALALPLTAQDAGGPTEPETMFYKAFYLEKGQRDFAGAMALYEQFLAKAPEHKLAGEAARQQFRLLDATGKTKERDAFKAKYEKLLGNVAATAPTPAVQERPARGGEGGERPARGEGGAAGGRPDTAARMAELEKQLAAAKEAGNADEVKRLEQQIERMKSMGNRGQGGPGGTGGRGRGGLMGAVMGGKPVAEMSDEEIGQLKSGIEQSSQMIDMMRERNPEQADKLEKGVADLKKALDAGDKAAAQTALDALKSAMPARGGRGNRGGGGGEAGGAGAGAGGGGRGGNGGGGGGGGGI